MNDRVNLRRTRLLAAMLLGLLVAGTGCAGPRGGTGSDAPRQGGVLIYAKGKDATRLDPADVNEAESATVTENIFNGLVRFKKDSTEIEPALATGWDVSKDGKTYTFHLRKGVHFHDGAPFDAHAVKLSFDRQARPQPGQVFEYWANFFAGTVKDVTVLAPMTVQIRLKAPDATFLSNLALYSMAILSPRALAKWGVDVARHPVGTGPFRFVKWVPGERLVLEANPDYWDGRPYLDKLIFKPVSDNAVRLLELEVGEVDGMDGINPDDVSRIEANPELVFRAQAGLNVGYLALNNLKPPFDDARVRRAVALAIDKPALVRAFFADGRLGEGAVTAMPPTIWGYNHRLKDLSHDPAEARRLLASAGYPGGLSIELWSLPVARPYMPQGQRTAEAIQASLAQVGITATLRTYEWGTYLDKVGKGEHQAALIGWVGDFADPDNFLFTLLDAANARPGGGATNYSFYRGEAVHRLLTRARTTLDPSRRARLYEEAQALIQQDTPMVPLFHAKQLAAFRQRVRGFALHPTGTKSFERVWLSD